MCIVGHCKTGLVPVDIPAISLTVCGVGCRRSCSFVKMTCKLRGISVRGGIITFIANGSNDFHFLVELEVLYLDVVETMISFDRPFDFDSLCHCYRI